jgi:hypothetical protein
MSNDKELPSELSTAHEVTLLQSSAITKLSRKVEAQQKALQEALAEIRFHRSGKKCEKFINADQMLLEFPDDKELQDALEAAKNEAEAELERITYIRHKAKQEKKPASDKFPAHLPREVIEVPIPEAYQQRIDSRELVMKRYEITETLQSIPAKPVVHSYKKPILAYADKLEKELLVDGEANLGLNQAFADLVFGFVWRAEVGARTRWLAKPDRWLGVCHHRLGCHSWVRRCGGPSHPDLGFI